MRIVVAGRGHAVAPQWCDAQTLNLYTAQDAVLIAADCIPVPVLSEEKLSEFLRQVGVDLLIAGEIYDGLRRELETRGIQCVVGATGNAKAAAQGYLDGRLQERVEGASNQPQAFENEYP